MIKSSQLRIALVAAGCLVALATSGQAQEPWLKDFAHLPPGVVGRRQLMRPNSPLRGYYQPVQLHVPAGSTISIARNGRFTKPQKNSLKVGLLVGQVYRLRVTNIRFREGEEVYPTIELVNRLFPPEGKKWRFPVPIEFTQEELQFALRGRLVTRVVYLEDPKKPLPRRQGIEQRYFEVDHKVDPLTVADKLGRPMAIMRMGSRVPGRNGVTQSFLFGSPPLLLINSKAKKSTLQKQKRSPVVRLPQIRRQPRGVTAPRQSPQYQSQRQNGGTNR